MIHLFGCSFTKGSGLIPEPELNIDIPAIRTFQYSNYIWPKFLKEYVEEEVKNNAEGGASNHYIRDTVVEHMEEFSKGDTIIIGITSSARLSFPYYHKVHNQFQYLHVLPNVVEYFESVKAKKEKMHWNGSYLDLDYANAISTYYLEAMAAYEVDIEKRDRDLLNSLSTLLNKSGYRCIIWDSGLWGFAEKITNWTSGKIQDSHWSPNGHRLFSLVIKYAIDNNITYIDPNKYLRISTQVRPKYKEYEYINYIHPADIYTI